MSYDYGISEISKHTKITGVKAKHIAKDLTEQGIDWMAIDWKTIGEDVSDYGDRYSAIWKKLGNMYGIGKSMTKGEYKGEIGRYTERIQTPLFTQKEIQLEMCLSRHLKRTPISIMLDDRRIAKHRFQPTFLKGVQIWMKNPERYDVIGIDYFPGTYRRRKKKRSKKHR
jgi:hypothetical protein